MRRAILAHSSRLWPWLTVLALVSLFCFGVFRNLPQIGLFESSYWGSHPAAARALYNGQLHLSRDVTLGLFHDYEYFNGASFTHWGYGVPLLQLPFHLLATAFSPDGYFRYFPDRTIFIVYLVLSTSLLFVAVRRTILQFWKTSEAEAGFAATGISVFFLSFSLYWLISLYFGVYEETVSYFILSQIVALSFYLQFRCTRDTRWLYWIGFALGLGGLIRATGWVYLGIWSVVFFHELGGSGGVKKTDVTKVWLASLPALLVWLVTNYFKSGSFFSAGFENAFSVNEEVHALRFGGNPCLESVNGRLTFLGVILSVLFGRYVPDPPLYPGNLPDVLQGCSLLVDSLGAQKAPLIWPWVMIAALWLSYRDWRATRKLTAPMAICGLALLIGLYTHAGSSFGVRYVGDLWPLLLLVFSRMLFSPQILGKGMERRAFRSAFLALVVTVSALKIGTNVVPQFETISVSDPGRRMMLPPLALEKEKIAIRTFGRLFQWEEVPYQEISMASPRIPAARACPVDAQPHIELDGHGWNPDCSTWAITSLMLGVPERPSRKDGRYQVVIETGYSNPLPRPVQIYVNGKTYKTELSGPMLVMPLELDFAKLYSPVVAVSVQWLRGFSDSGINLFRITIE